MRSYCKYKKKNTEDLKTKLKTTPRNRKTIRYNQNIEKFKENKRDKEIRKLEDVLLKGQYPLSSNCPLIGKMDERKLSKKFQIFPNN